MNQEIIIANLLGPLFVLVTLTLSSLLNTLIVPRLELAKGIKGSTSGIQTQFSGWGLDLAWNRLRISWQSIWVVVLALYTCFFSAALSKAFGVRGYSNLELTLPALLVLIRACTIMGRYQEEGAKSHKLREDVQGIVLLATISILTMQMQAHVTEDLLKVLIQQCARITGACLYIFFLPTFTDKRDGVEPEAAVRFSELAAVFGFTYLFLPARSSEPELFCLEMLVKTVCLLLVFDVVSSLSQRVKKKTMENLYVRYGAPLLFVWIVFLVWGL